MMKQAFIFAAGRGTRMAPVTDEIPKPLVKVNNRPIIDYTIEKLDNIPSISKIIINGYYLAEQIESYVTGLNNNKIIFSKESKKVETGGGLVFASDKINLSEPLLLINGDLIWFGNQDLKLLWQKWQDYQIEGGTDILLGLKRKTDFPGYEGGGDFDYKDGALFYHQGRDMSHAFIGIQIISPSILKSAPTDCFSMSYFYHKEIDNYGLIKNVKGLELPGRYLHVSKISDIKGSKKLIEEEKWQ